MTETNNDNTSKPSKKGLTIAVGCASLLFVAGTVGYLAAESNGPDTIHRSLRQHNKPRHLHHGKMHGDLPFHGKRGGFAHHNHKGEFGEDFPVPLVHQDMMPPHHHGKDVEPSSGKGMMGHWKQHKFGDTIHPHHGHRSGDRHHSGDHDPQHHGHHSGDHHDPHRGNHHSGDHGPHHHDHHHPGNHDDFHNHPLPKEMMDVAMPEDETTEETTLVFEQGSQPTDEENSDAESLDEEEVEAVPAEQSAAATIDDATIKDLTAKMEQVFDKVNGGVPVQEARLEKQP